MSRVTNRVLLFVFGLALAARILNLALIDDVRVHAMIEDSSHYWRGAQAWLDKGPMMHMSGAGGVYTPQTERVPLYHIFLIPFIWVFGDSVEPVLIGQAILDSVTCVVVAILGTMIAPKVGLVSGILAALWPNMIIHSSMILGDSLFLALFSVLLLFCARFLQSGRTSDTATAGLMCGLAIMTRPIALFVPIAAAIAAPLIVAHHRRSRRSMLWTPVLFLAMAALPSLPLVAHNIHNYGTAALTSQSGPHMLYWVVGSSLAQIKGRPFDDVAQELHKSFTEWLQERNLDIETLNPFQESRLELQYAYERLEKIPKASLATTWLLNGAINLTSPALLIDPRVRSTNRHSYYATGGADILSRMLAFLRGNSAAYITFFSVGVAAAVCALILQAGGWILLSIKFPWAAVFAALVILYFLLANGPVASPKYRLPFEPVLIVCQGLALVWLWSFFRRRSVGRMSDAPSQDA